MARKLLVSAPVILAALLHGGASSAALHVAESPLCRVALTKVSYDDPDVDDAEFLELAVERVENPDGPPTEPRPEPPAPSEAGDASAPCTVADGAVDAGPGFVSEGGTPPGRLTLADCGLSALELVSGGGAECEAYRSLPLGEAPVPDDGILVVCASDSGLAVLGLCNVTTAGRSALKNGWIQNGPRDGMRFVRTDGTAVELGYEGRLSCFSSGAPVLADESGVTSNSSNEDEDDVGVLCDNRYVLLPISRAPLRAASDCPPPPLAEDAGPWGSDASNGRDPDGASPPDPATPWTPEFAPTPSRRPGTEPPASGPVYLDAGSFELPQRESSPPRPPACTVASPTNASRLGLPLLSVLLAGTTAWRRFRRPRLPR